MRISLWLAVALATSVPAVCHAGEIPANQAFASVELLNTGKTVLNEDIVYPTSGPAKVQASIVTVSPDSPAKLHHHPTPMFAYILEGEITIDYGAAGKHTFKKGDALIETVKVSHRGIDIREPVKILTVSMGAEGIPNVVVDQPAPSAK
jgi:quercetin dioxygenase-like cupin family protein